MSILRAQVFWQVILLKAFQSTGGKTGFSKEEETIEKLINLQTYKVMLMNWNK